MSVDYTRSFNDIYHRLQQTLVECYPEEATDIPKMDMRQWYMEIGTMKENIDTKNTSIFSTYSGTNRMFSIVSALWMDNKFTPNSKRYIWTYLQLLTRYACSTMQPRDIAPPVPEEKATPVQTTNIQTNGLMSSVHQIADKYSGQIERGERKLEDLNFQEISQDLFSTMKPEEMQHLLQNMGQMMNQIQRQ